VNWLPCLKNRQEKQGVITVGMLAKIRRMHIRDGLSLREIARRTGLSRNTIRDWLRQADIVEPKYPKRVTKSVLDPWTEQLSSCLKTDRHRLKRDRHTARVLYQTIKQQGYAGGYGRVRIPAKPGRHSG
jgi:transposase